MQRILFITFSVCILASFSTILSGQNNSSEQQQVIEMELFENPDITHFTGYGNCQWLFPLDEPNEILLEQPDYKSDKLYYYAAKYGDADDNIYTIIIDESKGTGKGYDTVYVDSDNNNRIDPDNEKFLFDMSTTRTERPLRIKLTVSAGSSKFPYYFNFTAFPYTDDNHPVEKIHANARNSSIFSGTANFDRKDYKIAIADLDSNGIFNDVEKGLFQGDRFFVDFDDDGRFQGDSPGDSAESFSYGEYTNIREKWYSIKASADGSTIHIEKAAPEFGKISVPENVTSLLLLSETQSQNIKFSSGPAQAITGTYDLRSITLSATDNSERTWTTQGTFRSDKPKVTITPGSLTSIDDILPLEVAVEPTGKSSSGEVRLEVKISGRKGEEYRVPRARECEGSFEIQDELGNVVDSGDFEYG